MHVNVLVLQCFVQERDRSISLHSVGMIAMTAHDAISPYTLKIFEVVKHYLPPRESTVK